MTTKKMDMAIKKGDIYINFLKILIIKNNK